jgi:hypothetical protein
MVEKLSGEIESVEKAIRDCDRNGFSPLLNREVSVSMIIIKSKRMEISSAPFLCLSSSPSRSRVKSKKARNESIRKIFKIS